MRGSGEPPGLSEIEISNAYIGALDFTERGASGFSVTNSVIFTLRLPVNPPREVHIGDCEVARVEGITSASALPSWVSSLTVDEFDSAATVAQIRRIGLTPAQEILIAIIKKTFFQKGSGRKEEALMRGFGNIAPAGLALKIVNLLLRENIIRRFRGEDGWVYAPNREFAGRMKLMIQEMRGSQDELWSQVTEL